MSEPSPRLVLSASTALALLAGFLLGCLYSEVRRVTEFAQLAQIAHTVTAIGERCVASLDGVTRAAIVVVRNERAEPQAPPPRFPRHAPAVGP